MEYYFEHEGRFYTPTNALDHAPDYTNQELGQAELSHFRDTKPDNCFCYVDEKRRVITTWTGDILGTITYMGPRYRAGWTRWSKRRPITAIGINGIRYHGTYYCSSGDYARIYAYKHQKSED